MLETSVIHCREQIVIYEKLCFIPRSGLDLVDEHPAAASFNKINLCSVFFFSVSERREVREKCPVVENPWKHSWVHLCRSGKMGLPQKDLKKVLANLPFYLRCSMTEMSPLSGSKPFMNKPPFLARGVDRPCIPASLSIFSRSSLKVVLLGRVSSGLGLNPRSVDSLRLMEAARWNLS